MSDRLMKLGFILSTLYIAAIWASYIWSVLHGEA